MLELVMLFSDRFRKARIGLDRYFLVARVFYIDFEKFVTRLDTIENVFIGLEAFG